MRRVKKEKIKSAYPLGSSYLFFWIPGRGRFAPLPGMTGLRASNNFILFST
jgi:hypothetical protein